MKIRKNMGKKQETHGISLDFLGHVWDILR